MHYYPVADTLGTTSSRAFDSLAHQIEHSTSVTIPRWFQRLDRIHARSRGLVHTLEWLRDKQRLAQPLAATLAWSYFHPETLPEDIKKKLKTGPRRKA